MLENEMGHCEGDSWMREPLEDVIPPMTGLGQVCAYKVRVVVYGGGGGGLYNVGRVVGIYGPGQEIKTSQEPTQAEHGGLGITTQDILTGATYYIIEPVKEGPIHYRTHGTKGRDPYIPDMLVHPE